MGDLKNIRVSLPPGTVLHGEAGEYHVVNIVCLSERSVTVSCTGAEGRKLRLKLYNGQSAMTKDVQKLLLERLGPGAVLPCDIGEFAGQRFAVTPELDVVSTDQFPVSLQVLTEKIIPGMARVIHHYHQRRILLRDICPAHILYKTSDESIGYCGFNNAAVLGGKATTTKTPGFGQEACYLAPEVEQYGYSVFSDYFSLGVTILTLLKGSNPMENLSRTEFLQQLSRGIVPGVDIQHLRNTPYELYSEEDRVLYLVLGLMLPDYRQRWEFGEIRCWYCRQKIPLVQRGQRIRYQFSEPYVTGGRICWNQRQLAETVAACQSAWKSPGSLAAFAEKQHLRCAKSLREVTEAPSLSEQGKVFRCVYTMYPEIDGLWWEGRRYSDTTGLARAVKDGTLPEEAFSQMLRDGALSFFVRCKQRMGNGGAVDLSEIEAIEYLEAAGPGQGVQRGMMLFAEDPKSRFFTVKNKRYYSLAQLLEEYQNAGGELKKLSQDILTDSGFQAWLWAKGLEKAGKEAVKAAEKSPKQSFFFLLSLCESMASELKIKKTTRRLYLRWGDYAPLVWLSSNVKYYQIISPTNQVLYDVFAKTGFSLDASLEELRQQGNTLMREYQLFVSKTLDNPFVLENENPEDFGFGFYPMYESGYFCCEWENGLEVCPAFLKSLGESVDANRISEWLQNCGDAASKRLDQWLAQLPAYDNSGEEYLSVCEKNLRCAVFMLAAAALLLVVGCIKNAYISLPSFIAATLFPVCSVMWYYKKKARAGIWERSAASVREKRTNLETRIKKITTRRNEVYSGILDGQHVKCQRGGQADTGAVPNLDALEALELGFGQKGLGYLSMLGYVMLGAACGNAAYEPLSICIYAAMYGIAAPYFIRKRVKMSSCRTWAATVLVVTAAALFGGAAFGRKFFAVMDLIPVVVIVIGFLIYIGCEFFV